MLGLQLIRDGEVALLHRVTERMVHIGRASANDLILQDDRVSDHHAVIWRKGGRAWLRDLQSTNGTFVNGTQLVGPQPLEIGDQLAFGSTVLEVTRLRESTERRGTPVLEWLDSQVSMPLSTQRFRVGGGLDCDMILPDSPPHLLTLFIDDLDVWVGTDEREHPAEVDVPFEVQGRTFVIRHRRGDPEITVVPSSMQLEIRLAAGLDGPTGPYALVTDLNTDASHRIEAENRALLLYLLGKAFQEGRARGESVHDAGWCGDLELRNAIWGRLSGSNQLNVLLHRLRGELRDAGLDPWFLEKRRRYTRARLTEIELS